jgi:D-aminopeptidase
LFKQHMSLSNLYNLLFRLGILVAVTWFPVGFLHAECSDTSFEQTSSLKSVKKANAHAQARIMLPQWRYSPGPWNAITDVPGVKVGHVSIRKESPQTIQTGVTAILPHSEDLANIGLWAYGQMLNGNGELTGLGPLQTSGILNSPILLTNTHSVGIVHQGVFDYFAKHYPSEPERSGSSRWRGELPVVGECWDGMYNTIWDRRAITPHDAVVALEQATSGEVPQGKVGAGSGMRSFGLRAGIGSASRRLSFSNPEKVSGNMVKNMAEHSEKHYTIGVLVNTNHSRMEDLDPVILQKLETYWKQPLERIKAQDEQALVLKKVGFSLPASVKPISEKQISESTAMVLPRRQGSIIVVVATDLPLLPHQLKTLVERVPLGLGAMGSRMGTSSGDGVVIFSTATKIPLETEDPFLQNIESIHPDEMTPIYHALVEAVTEAQINALLAAHPINEK